MGKSNLIRNSILILSALLAWQAIKDQRLKTARETRNDKWAIMENLWTDDQIEHVKETMRNIGKFLATSGIDNKCTVDHIGERKELLEDGTCGDGLLVPNHNRTYCALAGRIDVGKHHIIGGGPTSKKLFIESIKKQIGTVFFQQHFSQDEDINSVGQITKNLFESDRYKKISESFCPAPQVTHREMFSLTILLPGQETPIHYDTPYFKRIGRSTAPVWLLVALKQSGLWADEEIKHTQGVAYIHGNKIKPGINGGDFVFYPHGSTGEKVAFQPKYNTGIFLDGTKTAHGVEPFEPKASPIGGQTHTTKELRYAGDKAWNFYENDEIKGQFKEEDMRLGVVWRELCLENHQAYENWLVERESLNANDALEVLVNQLEKEGYKIPESKEKLAELILDRFIHLPLGDGSIPYNYCIIPEMWKQFLPAEYASVLKYYSEQLLRPIC